MTVTPGRTAPELSVRVPLIRPRKSCAVLTLAVDLSSYLPIGILVLMAIAFVVVNLVATHLLGPRKSGAEKDIPYDSLVQVMDTVRILEQRQGEQLVQAELFPNVSIGDAPEAEPGVAPAARTAGGAP